MSTQISSQDLARAAGAIASAREGLQAVTKLHTALTTKRMESQQAETKIAEAMTDLESAEAAAAVDPQLSAEGARAGLRRSREQKEYVDAAITGLTRQRADAIALLKEALRALKIARNIRAQARLQEIQAEMTAAVDTILQGLSRAKGVCAALGQSPRGEAHLRSLVGGENLLSAAHFDSTVASEEEAMHSDIRELLRAVESACGE